MARLPFRCDDAVICEGLAALRTELEIPERFPDDVISEAEASAAAGPKIPEGSAATTVTDRTDLPLVTIDPPSSMDLDQAVHAAKTADGWRVHYAIADVAAWVTPGGAIDRESQARGFTMYSPRPHRKRRRDVERGQRCRRPTRAARSGPRCSVAAPCVARGCSDRHRLCAALRRVPTDRGLERPDQSPHRNCSSQDHARRQGRTAAYVAPTARPHHS